MFLLQQGWGMLTFINNFLSNHSNSGIILSPRICERSQLERYYPNISEIPNSEIFFDPHFYEPRTDLPRILSYPYFNNFNFQTTTFNHSDFCNQVIEYQANVLNLHNIILPGRYTNSLSESWLDMQRTFAELGNNYRSLHEIYSTLAIGPDLILNPDHFNTIIDEVINYPVDGIYLVFEHPSHDFLLSEEFIYVILDAILSISLSKKKIILGYSNHQSIIFYASGIDYLASGNYRNVRAFDHLNSTDRDNDNLRKGVWYFDGNTFGEYKIPALGLAFRRNLRNHFGPITNYNSTLLSSNNPTTIPWREPDAFSNYFDLLNHYCSEINNIIKNQRANYLLNFFNSRRDTNQALSNANFNFGDRGFNNHIEGTIAALEAFIRDRSSDIINL
ncbi:MAG: hypothetical protein P4L45_00560 [Ignavibacteriaceae bacterium]|nr:hypothetical protein [Ignavibacteriaceae bacterium]